MLLLAFMSLQLSAVNEQSITINGTSIDKVVKSISFDGDYVVLTYTDDTSDREDMELVVLAFMYDEHSTGIETIRTNQVKLAQPVFSVNGMVVGKSVNGLRPGVYIVHGKKVLVK